MQTAVLNYEYVIKFIIQFLVFKITFIICCKISEDDERDQNHVQDDNFTKQTTGDAGAHP